MQPTSYEQGLLVNLARQFEAHFGCPVEKIFKAPGRVNLIGEHTDYNDGFVLPVAIDRFTWIATSQRADRYVEAIALDMPSHTCVRFSLDEMITPSVDAQWGNYLKGVVAELLQRNEALCGVNMAIVSTVPLGAGLSSSAALEVAAVAACMGTAGLVLTGQEAARIGQIAENDFVGCQCGIMDQLIVALGRANQAMQLDCRNLDMQFVDIPKQCELVIVNSNVKRGLRDSEYNARRQQCEQVASFFGLRSLRGLDLTTLERAQGKIDDILYRRARHVVTENARVLQAADALASGDLATMGALMATSHVSMRDDFEITVPAIDTLVNIMQDVLGKQAGARMTGGGFGGCVVALIPSAVREELVQAIEGNYSRVTGLQPSILLCRASAGVF